MCGGKKVVEEKGLLCVQENKVMVWIVPQQIRKDVMRWIHGSQAGGRPEVRAAKERIQEMGWWRGRNQDLEDLIDGCLICARYDPFNRKRSEELMRRSPV